MTKKKELVLINEENLKNKIYIIRGQKVMLDSDLAEIYGYDTRSFNKQVKNNIDKFPSDFMFRLTKEEVYEFLMCKNCTLKNVNNNRQGMHYKKWPYVFTESGIYMLMTVLKGPLAIKQSIMLIRLFKGMKDTLNDNGLLPSNILRQVELKIIKHDNEISNLNSQIDNVKFDLDKVMNNFIDPSTYKEFLILNGNKLEADKAYEKILKLAKHSIIYIDDYINLKTLSLLSLSNKNITINIISDNKAKDKITSFIINDFISQNPNNKLTILENNNICHDRFIILDFNTKNEKIYHCGASLKDAGNKITTILKINNTNIYKDIIKTLLKNNQLKIK